MSEKPEESIKLCDCNQGRLPCTCKPEPVLILSTEDFDKFETDLENRPLETNLSAQRLLRRPSRWS
jgi:hypothetical protein